MRFDFALQQARVREKERREHMWRVVKAVVGSLVAGGCRVGFRLCDGLARCALVRRVDARGRRVVAVQYATSRRWRGKSTADVTERLCVARGP